MANKKRPRNKKVVSEQADDDSRNLTVDLRYPTDLTTRYANHLAVQRGPNETFIMFYEIRPPVVTGATPEEIAEKRKSITSLRANCVARLVVPNQLMAAVAMAIQDNVQKAADQADTEKQSSDKNQPKE